MKNNAPTFVFSTETNQPVNCYTNRSDDMLSLPEDELQGNVWAYV